MPFIPGGDIYAWHIISVYTMYIQRIPCKYNVHIIHGILSLCIQWASPIALAGDSS